MQVVDIARVALFGHAPVRDGLAPETAWHAAERKVGAAQRLLRTVYC